jgi:hypothetical protein
MYSTFASNEIHVKVRGLKKPIFAVTAAVQTNPVDRPDAEQQFLSPSRVMRATIACSSRKPRAVLVL